MGFAMLLMTELTAIVTTSVSRRLFPEWWSEQTCLEDSDFNHKFRCSREPCICEWESGDERTFKWETCKEDFKLLFNSLKCADRDSFHWTPELVNDCKNINVTIYRKYDAELKGAYEKFVTLRFGNDFHVHQAFKTCLRV